MVVEAFAEEFAPFSYMENGKPVGYATELLQAVCAEARITCKISIFPWARAYHEAQSRPNGIVFSTARTGEREASFTWIGPIAPRRVYFYVRSDSPLHIARVEDLRGLKIGVVNDDAIIGQLAQLGIGADRIERAPNGDLNIRKLLAGRVDTVPFTDIGMAWTLHGMGVEPSTFRQEMLFADASALYYALNRECDPAVVLALKQAWDKVAASAERRGLAEKYALPLPNS